MPSILFVINAAIKGGAERHTAQLAQGLAHRGFETAVFALRRGTEMAAHSAEIFEPIGRESAWRRTRALAHLLKERRFDLLVAVNQRPLAIVAAAKALARQSTPVAAVLHTTLLRNHREALMQYGYDLLYERAALVVFVSENQHRHWLGRGLRPRRAVTILNGIDTGHFSPPSPQARADARAQLGFDANALIVGCSAMLRREKNHVQLVEALAALRARGIEARCLLVGDGPLRGEIEAAAYARAVAHFVHFVGEQEDVRPFIAAFDVGILCSTAVETLSLSALEVMGAGVPMVMSDIGGASEIIDGCNGRTFRAGDLGALLEGLIPYADRAMREAAGRAARQTVKDRFTDVRMIDAHAEQFRRLIGAPGGS